MQEKVHEAYTFVEPKQVKETGDESATTSESAPAEAVKQVGTNLETNDLPLPRPTKECFEAEYITHQPCFDPNGQ